MCGGKNMRIYRAILAGRRKYRQTRHAGHLGGDGTHEQAGNKGRIAALAAGNFDLYYGEVRLPANWDLSALVGTGGSLNYGGWADPQTEQLLAACAAAEDRAAALSDLCAYLQQQAPILPLCFKSSSVLYQTGAVSGLTPTAAEPFYDLPSCQIHLRQP